MAVIPFQCRESTSIASTPDFQGSLDPDADSETGTIHGGLLFRCSKKTAGGRFSKKPNSRPKTKRIIPDFEPPGIGLHHFPARIQVEKDLATLWPPNNPVASLPIVGVVRPFAGPEWIVQRWR